MLPNPPHYEEHDLERFRDDSDWLRPAFEWLRYVGQLSVYLNSIGPGKPGVTERPARDYAVVRGLINRCSRLILADVKLAAEQRHGEAVTAFTRCICESAIIARWLMKRNDPEIFERYVADGLRSDLRLKDQIQARIAERGGSVLVVEDRMLNSIALCLSLAGMSEADVLSAKRMYDFNAICRDLQLSPEAYIAIQYLGSHAIHGTWTDLLFHYLEHDDTCAFDLRDNEVRPEANHLIVVALEVLSTLKEYLEFSVADEEARRALLDVCSQAQEGILTIFRAAVSEDYEEMGAKQIEESPNTAPGCSPS